MADRRLQVFYAVAKHGSFTRAAETLFMTQPAVTFQIKQLEEQFNTRLLDRGHGRVTLTPAGEIVFAYAERILGLTDEMETRIGELTDELTGVIAIGASQTIAAYWLPVLLDKFIRKHPRVGATRDGGELREHRKSRGCTRFRCGAGRETVQRSNVGVHNGLRRRIAGDRASGPCVGETEGDHR